MKFCIRCGAQLNDDDLFCYRCGNKCIDVPKEANEPSVAEINKELEKQVQEVQEIHRKIEEEKALEETPVEEPVAQNNEDVPIEKEEEVVPEVKEEEPVVIQEVPQEEVKKEEPVVIQETPQEEVKKENPPVVQEAPIGEVKDNKAFNRDGVIKHALLFTGLLVGISIIYWFLGAFFSIHLAIKIIAFLIFLGALVIPVLDLIKTVMFMIKNKKFDLFLVVLLGICQLFIWTFITMNFSVMIS